VAIALPFIVVLVSGVLLQLKKQVDWIQPPTQRGSQNAPSISFTKVLETAMTVPQAEIHGWEDIDRLDVRPERGVLKVRAKNRWEIQIDAHSGEVLQVAYRRSDLLETIHDGSFFLADAKLWIFLPVALVLIGLWGTGLYLFAVPHLVKRERRKLRPK
jgi:uncharacterized iron-regulated membrane protein